MAVPISWYQSSQKVFWGAEPAADVDLHRQRICRLPSWIKQQASWESTISHYLSRTSNRAFIFYRDILKLPVYLPPGRATAFRGDGAIVLAGQVALGLQCHDDHNPDKFDHRQVGLDHLALQVSDRQTLEQWAMRLDDSNWPHSEITEVGNMGHHLFFRDPDDIQLELFSLVG